MAKSKNTKKAMYERHSFGPFSYYRATSINAELIRLGLTTLTIAIGLWLLTVTDIWYVGFATIIVAFVATEILHYFFADHPPAWLLQTLRQKP